MMYNFVESCLRDAIVAIRNDIHTGNYEFKQLTEFWQSDITKAHFYERLSQGTNHAEFIVDVTNFTKLPVRWSQPEKRLPFSGNLDQSLVLRLSKDLKCNWKPPKGTLGGAYLTVIKTNRNDLAHGAETFEDVGTAVDVKMMINELDRIRKFLLSFVDCLERYRVQKKFLR